MTNNLLLGVKGHVFNAEFDNGNSGTAKVIDFTGGSLQKVTLTGACAFTLTPPSGPSWVQLRCIAGAGAGQPTFATTVNWFESATPPLTALVATKVTIFSFFYDGAAWYGSGGRYNP
jgi:hypothetical protein